MNTVVWLSTVLPAGATGAGVLTGGLVAGRMEKLVILPELGPRRGDVALRILHRRGLEVRLNTTLEEVTDRHVRLSDGMDVPTRTLV